MIVRQPGFVIPFDPFSDFLEFVGVDELHAAFPRIFCTQLKTGLRVRLSSRKAA
jgi:hypothetical protein